MTGEYTKPGIECLEPEYVRIYSRMCVVLEHIRQFNNRQYAIVLYEGHKKLAVEWPDYHCWDLLVFPFDDCFVREEALSTDGCSVYWVHRLHPERCPSCNVDPRICKMKTNSLAREEASHDDQ